MSIFKMGILILIPSLIQLFVFLLIFISFDFFHFLIRPIEPNNFTFSNWAIRAYNIICRVVLLQIFALYAIFYFVQSLKYYLSFKHPSLLV